MLILPKYLQAPERNPIWALRTPNEAYEQELGYSELVDEFAKKHRVPPAKFFEVRCIGSKLYKNDTWWYDDPYWADKIFWVYQKPLNFYPPGEERWQAWALEPLEHMRIHQVHRQMDGSSPYAADQLFLLPCDAGQICWTETSAGVSDHVQYRPEVTPTQEQVDYELGLQETVDKIMSEAVEIPADSKVFEDDRRAYDTKVNRASKAG